MAQLLFRDMENPAIQRMRGFPAFAAMSSKSRTVFSGSLAFRVANPLHSDSIVGRRREAELSVPLLPRRGPVQRGREELPGGVFSIWNLLNSSFHSTRKASSRTASLSNQEICRIVKREVGHARGR
jgi:hypothetical protein